jgi:hypothetical protein
MTRDDLFSSLYLLGAVLGSFVIIAALYPIH